MRRFWKGLLFAPLLALAMVAGCESGTGSSGVPTGPEHLLGGVLGGNKVKGYTLVKDPVLSGVTQAVSTSGLIGATGGQLTLLGHTLTVPVGAVSGPTLFTLIVLPTGYVEVDLSATVSSLLGGVLDVGSKGFLKPVPVRLSYARATNVSDPRKLTILRITSLLGYSKYQVLPSRVDQKAKTVSTELDHFSRYTVAFPY